MAIQAKCPSCEKVYNLRDSQAGARVVCRQCAEQFTVPGGAVRAPAREDRSRESATPPRRPRRRDAADNTSPKGSLTWLWILLGVFGGLGILTLCVCGGFYFMIMKPAQDALAPPRDIDMAVQRLDTNYRVGDTAIWLQKQNVDPSKQQAVAKALVNASKGAIFNRKDIFEALEIWATSDQVPFLMQSAQHDFGAEKTASINALLRLRDPQSYGVLISLADEPGLKTKIEAALQSMVAQNPKVTTDSMVSILNGNDNDTAKRLADYLVRQSPDARTQKALAPALANAVTARRFPLCRDAMVKALCKWATVNEVPDLITLLRNEQFTNRDDALDALVRLKDQRGIDALKTMVNDPFFGPKAKNALRQMGVPVP